MKLGETHKRRKPHQLKQPHPITVARAKKGLTLRELAERVEMSVPGLNHIETGLSQPHRSTRRLLESELGPIKWPEPAKKGKK